MTTREQVEQEAEDRAAAINHSDIGYEYGYEAGFIAGRTVNKDVDELLRDDISDALLAAPGYKGSEYHPDVVTNVADAIYEHLGLVIEGEE